MFHVIEAAQLSSLHSNPSQKPNFIPPLCHNRKLQSSARWPYNYPPRRRRQRRPPFKRGCTPPPSLAKQLTRSYTHQAKQKFELKARAKPRQQQLQLEHKHINKPIGNLLPQLSHNELLSLSGLLAGWLAKVASAPSAALLSVRRKIFSSDTYVTGHCRAPRTTTWPTRARFPERFLLSEGSVH